MQDDASVSCRGLIVVDPPQEVPAVGSLKKVIGH